MKKVTLKQFSYMFLPIFLLSILQVGCKKDKDEEKNLSPTCTITSPLDGATYKQGEMITLTASASDPDGSISSVKFYLNDQETASLTSSPYSFQWETTTASAGDYFLKATAIDNEGAKNSSQIMVKITGGSVINGDTVYPGNILNAQNFLLYELTGDSGFIVGTNLYGDIAKAQQFEIESGSAGYEIKGGIFWFAYKNSSGGGDLKLSVWNMDGNTGITTAGENQTCPQSLLIEKSVPITDIDTSSQLSLAHVQMFDTSVAVSSDYVMGIEMSDLAANDEIALVTSEDGEGNNFELSWEQWNNGQWASILAIYGADFDIAIFPLLSSQAANVKDGNFIFGMKLSQAKRSFSRKCDKIEFELETNTKSVELEIYDIIGNRLIYKSLGSLPSGKHSVLLNEIKLPKGTYINVLHTDGKKLAKELIID